MYSIFLNIKNSNYILETMYLDEKYMPLANRKRKSVPVVLAAVLPIAASKGG